MCYDRAKARKVLRVSVESARAVTRSTLYGGRRMVKGSVLLMIAALVCALFADKIDAAVKGDKKVKKVVRVFSVGVFLVGVIAVLASVLA